MTNGEYERFLEHMGHTLEIINRGELTESIRWATIRCVDCNQTITVALGVYPPSVT